MYTTRICPYCRMAERLLEKKGIADVDRIMVDDQPERREEMTRRTGRKTVPQIFIGETHVGGYTDLADLDRHGKLDPLLAQP
jgi:glutaredoxin 3